MKDRDRLAHWSWGLCEDLPDALLIAEPSYTLVQAMAAFRSQHEMPGVPANFEKIFVLREVDLTRILKRSQEAKFYLRMGMGAVWHLNDPAVRASLLQELSNVPQIREAMTRQTADKNTQESRASPPLQGSDG